MFSCNFTYVLAFTLCSSWLCPPCGKQRDQGMARLVVEVAADRHENCSCRFLPFRVGRAAAPCMDDFSRLPFQPG